AGFVGGELFVSPCVMGTDLVFGDSVEWIVPPLPDGHGKREQAPQHGPGKIGHCRSVRADLLNNLARLVGKEIADWAMAVLSENRSKREPVGRLRRRLEIRELRGTKKFGRKRRQCSRLRCARAH